MKIKRSSPLLKKAKRAFRGYPVATLAFYGPDNVRASKVAIGVVLDEGGPPIMFRLFSDTDVRHDPYVTAETERILKANGVKSVVSTGMIIGCPHEEDVDYVGPVCPQCPFWAHRDRFTHDLIQ